MDKNVINPLLCLRCKGAKNLCGLPYCPLLRGIKEMFPPIKVIKSDFNGPSPPSVFVGRYGYPYVNVSPLITPYEQEDPSYLDNPSKWFGLPIEKIIAMRGQLYQARGKLHVQPYKNRDRVRIFEASQLMALSKEPLEAEVRRMKPPPPLQKLTFDVFAHPMGPKIIPRKIDVIDNPKVPRCVDDIVSDIDVRSINAVEEIYKNGIDINQIVRLFSVGLLGSKKNRRLVPTRWSITAVDDILGRSLIENIRDYPQVSEILLYNEKYMGNNIFILILPGIFSFEMIEKWMKGSFWSPPESTFMADYEDYRGRKTYATNITGAYYAARLAVLENLKKKKRQGAVLIYREITEEYLAPLGVWMIRETTRKALEKIPIKFYIAQEAIEYVNKRVRGKNWWRRSRTLNVRKVQKRIEDFYKNI